MNFHKPADEAIDAFYRGLEPFWHPILKSEELRSSPTFVELLGRPLAAVRLDTGPCLVDDTCCHLGASLSLGKVLEGKYLQCAYHGWTYDRTGRCVDIPARRELPIPGGARVGSYPVVERFGIVWACLKPELEYEIPAFPEFDDPEFRVTRVEMYEPWHASAPRLIMGALDDTHFPWLHPGILGDADYPEAPEHEAYVEGSYVVSTHRRFAPAYEEAGRVEVRREAYCTPTSIRLVVHRPTSTDIVWEAVCPVAYDTSVAFIVMARDYDRNPASDEKYLEREKLIQAQDRPIAESQRPWLLPPLSARHQLFVRPDDVPLVALQRWLEELGIPQV